MLFEDLWRLTALTLMALVGIVSFAAGMRPLAGGQLGPADALRYMALAAVPMLQFTAPFAAGFAATLTHHRFAAENEYLASSAGGISNRSLLAPALALGLALTIVVAALANFVIPSFLRSMQELVSRDVARLLISSIGEGKAVELNGLVIHADRAISGQADPARGESDRIFLTGVVAFDTADDGSINAEITAERAEVLLSKERLNNEPVTVVRMRLEGAVGKQPGEGLGEVGTVHIGPWYIPNAFRETPKLLTYTQLRRLNRAPARLSDVDLLRRRLAGVLTRRRAVRLLRAAVSNESRVVLTDSIGRRVAIQADEIHRDGSRWRLSRGEGQGVELDWLLKDGSRRTQRARRAWITVSADETPAPASITLDLEEVGADKPLGAVRDKVTLNRLRLETDPGADFYAEPTRTLLKQAQRIIELASDAEQPGSSAARGAAPRDAAIASLVAARNTLVARIGRLKREIVGNNHERFALASSCLLMTLTGAIMALRLRDGMPLQVYLWSFFPALGAVITISGGESVVADNQTLGLIILWGGIAALTVYAAYEYRKLSRH